MANANPIAATTQTIGSHRRILGLINSLGPLSPEKQLRVTPERPHRGFSSEPCGLAPNGFAEANVAF